MSGEFCGVLSNWRRTGDHIKGDCLLHLRCPDFIGRKIHTGRVLSFYESAGFAVVWTAYSVYVLIDPVLPSFMDVSG